MGLRFGTDGIRGVANAELDAELVLALGRAAARVLPAKSFVVGRDTRRSGPLLQAAFSAGVASEGIDVIDLGVLPSPAVAWAAAGRGVPGAVVSASHNPFADNGIKLFAAGGLKLPDAVEQAIEAELGKGRAGPAPHTFTGHGVGRITAEAGVSDSYVAFLCAQLGGRDLAGLRVVVDCANGAASAIAPEVFRRLGAEVVAIADDPDGSNINDGCGSTHPERLAAEVVAAGADLGLALDGDADRLVAIDHTGALSTGDELLALFAADLASRDLLAGNAVVVTVMTNLGFRLAMTRRGIAVHETQVGDRYVLEALDASNFALGGEQSGHIIFRHLATTGDGTLTGVLLADLVRRSTTPLAELTSSAMTRVPQVLENVTVADPSSVVTDDAVTAEVAAVEAQLGGSGRVLLRASGTEPLVRVMVEAEDRNEAEAAAVRLAAVVRQVAASTPRVPAP